MKDLDLIYFAARELPPEARPAYLNNVCGSDHALRARVEQMLGVANEAEAFITDLDDDPEGPRPGRRPDQTRTPKTTSLPDETLGQRIGRYKILERVGEGGCGVVYVAEQTEPVRRRVALKVIKLGMDTRQVVARFEAERQALAMMDHPNIARVLDAGTTEAGRPFFVMELVRGIKITDYCEQAQLSTKERLDLFMKVCQAIQHAHQKGIIHRDIKPSNILVTLHDGVPVPKVIDFGIAKATEGRLTDATVYTQLHQLIGTPAYMSPEQAEMSGLDIDTRSDIYSLGVLLYELLVGTTPFDAKELLESGVDAMRKTIREKEPPRPSTKLRQTLGAAHTSKPKSVSSEKPGTEEEISASSRRLLRVKETIMLLKGDLDWIVMKCLEKDRSRRYETANSLVTDLKRHLDNEPVVARPPSAAYRLQKAVRRNKLAFIATAAVVLALLVGIGVSSWQAVRAKRATKAEIKQRLAAQEAQAQGAILQKKAEAERTRAEEQLTRAEWLVYASKLMLAQTDFEAGNGGLALHYLNECQVNLRGWEHRYLRTRVSAKQTLAGHASEVTSVAFSSDGRRIVTGSLDRTARVWDATTARELVALKGNTLSVLSVAISPDGQRIVTGSGERGVMSRPGEAKVWDAATGRELMRFKGLSLSVLTVAFSPDGKCIATGTGDWASGARAGEVKIWDATTGEERLTIPVSTGGVRCVAFSPDGKRIITGSWRRTAIVWDATNGQEVLALQGHTHWTTCAAFSPDGQRIVTGSDDRTAKVWDAATGQELLTLKEHSERLTGVAFSPDGKRIVTGGVDQAVKVWNAVTGGEMFTIKGHAGFVFSVAFSPDGQHIISGSADQTAKVWDAVAGQEVPTLAGHRDTVCSIAFSPDGQFIATASMDGTVKLWNATTARQIVTLAKHNRRVWAVAFSPDGRHVITGADDMTAKVWDVATGEELLILQHTNVVSSVAFSPNGKRIVTGVGESGRSERRPGEARIWDTATGREIFCLQQTNVVWSVAFSPDSQRIATGGGDWIAKVWDAATGQQVLALEGHTGALHSVAFSPDGKRIVTGSRDQTARVWDAATGRELLALKGHTSHVRSVVFSPDGKRIVTGSDDRTAKVWDAATGHEVLALKGHPQIVYSVAFSPDGNRIVTGSAGANAVARVWYAAPLP